MVTPRSRLILPMIPNTSLTSSGDNPIDGSSIRIIFGRALVARPKMILIDEPSMGLSPLLVKEVFGIIGKINRDLGVTILLVEQNARAALSVASHGYIMEPVSYTHLTLPTIYSV